MRYDWSANWLAISEGIHTLKRDLLAGKNVRKRQIPRYYVTKYGVNNLYILPLDNARRLSYTLASDKTGINVVILEAFPDHKSYERRFGYR